MLTTTIISEDAASASSVRAALQQTGLVKTVQDWGVSQDAYPSSSETIPDVVLLDLGRDTEPYFAFAMHLRRLRPSVRLIAVSPHVQPDPSLLLQAMRSGVQDFLQKPVNITTLRDTLARFAQEKVDDVGVPATEKLIVVMGSKGGVGTTTVAANLAVQLTQISRKRVVLLDFARTLGHVCLLLGLRPRFYLRDALQNLERLDVHFFGGLLCRHPTGLDVLAGTAHPEEWERITAPALARVVNVAHNSSDYIVMDSGEQYSPEWAPILRTARAILVVAETSVAALWSLERHLAATAALGIDPGRVSIVINRWSRRDDDALKALEKRTKHQVFRIPNDYRQASEAANVGMPLSGNHNNALVSKIQQLASDLVGVTPHVPERRGSVVNLFSFSAAR